jgi:NADH-quinone oxidoreductase subunit N
VVAVNAVIGLAYYVRVAAQLYAPGGSEPVRARLAWPVAAALAVAVAAVLVAGFLPQVVMDAAAR